MENFGPEYGRFSARDSSIVSNTGGGGVCLMSSTWKDEQHPSFIQFISSFLRENSIRLNFVPIPADFIFNCGGLSVAFVFVTNWDISSTALVFSRVQKLKGQFGNLYVVVNLPTREQNDSFIQSYFRYGMEIGRPMFVPVQDLEMGFEKIVRIAHARRMCKQQDAVAQMKAERERSVQNMDTLLQVLTAIPGIDSHDANAMNQAIGSIQAISKSSKDHILEKTDLSAEKAETVTRFFRDPDYYLSTKIN